MRIRIRVCVEEMNLPHISDKKRGISNGHE